MDLEDHLTPSSCLVCKIVHVGCQADASAMEKFINGSHHVCQYSWKTFRSNGKTCHSYNFPFHLNLRNFLTVALMGTWWKASLRFNPTHMVPYWNHFLTVLSSSIWKYTWQMYLLNFFRFRIGLHMSGLLLDLGTAKNELTYSPWTRPTS